MFQINGGLYKKKRNTEAQNREQEEKEENLMCSFICPKSTRYDIPIHEGN